MVEAGKEGKLEDETVSIHYEGLINVMKHLGILSGKAEYKKGVEDEEPGPRRKQNPPAGLIPKVGYGESVRRGRHLGRFGTSKARSWRRFPHPSTASWSAESTSSPPTPIRHRLSHTCSTSHKWSEIFSDVHLIGENGASRHKSRHK